MSEKPIILAVDDSPESLTLLVRLLTKEGFLVRPADSGELALAAVEASPPDLILLDVRMRGMDGLEVCRRLKARLETRQIPVILISAFAEVKEWVEGLQLGAADYISKPFQVEELMARVKAQLTLRQRTVLLDKQTAILSTTNEQLKIEIANRQVIESELRRNLDQTDRSGRALLSVLEDQKRAEEKHTKLEEQLRQSQKLEAIGQLSSGVAHDFNNLLGGIMGHAELLKMSLESGSPLMRHPEDIISCCTKAADLTRQLLTFARKAPLEFQKLDLNAFLKGVKNLLDRTIDRRIEIVTDIEEKPAVISGDRNQLENAFLNIAINARDAMPEGGRLSIVSETVDLKKNALECGCSETEDGPYVKISFTDTGTGMSEEVKDHIFEPFFTTKEVGKGTGLGLPSVYGCVKQHNGHITVESEPGKGTVFRIYLPVIQQATRVVGATDEEKLTPGTGTLLVVDDEVVYHHVISEIFGNLGYTVHCCARGAEALELYKKHMATIDVVILDMNMPEMNGLQCFRGLKKINPAVKVILSSGYGDNSDRQIMQNEGVCAFVQKPFKAADLAKKIKELIDAPRPPKGEHELE